MSWFGKNRLQEEHDTTVEDSRVEIVAHQEATKQQIDQVKEANDALNKVFAKNHFTLTIYVAAGGSPDTLTTKIPGETPKEWERKQ